MNEERRGEIVRLLAALNDGLPEKVRRPLSTLGFVHDTTHHETCEDCLANGFVSSGCERCKGAGTVEKRRRRDPYDTGRSLGVFGESSRKHEAGHERDRELARLEAQTLPPRSEADLLAEANAHAEAWETARRRLREKYDIEPVEKALAELRLVDEDACRALHAVHVYGWLQQTSPRVEAQLDRGLRFVSAWLPDSLRVPPAPPQRVPPLLTLAERNKRIRKLEREGATTQWLAAEFGLSVRQTNAIIAGETEAA